MIENLKRLIKDKEIEDIYLTGFVDIEDGIAQFYHDLRYVYFQINSNIIEFESINQFSKIKLNIVNAFRHSFEVDADMIMAKSSVSEIVLNDTMASGNNIETIIFYNLQKNEMLICDAIEMKLGNGQVIFLDPSYYFGINMGGEDQKQIWKNNYKDFNKVKKLYLEILNIS